MLAIPDFFVAYMFLATHGTSGMNLEALHKLYRGDGLIFIVFLDMDDNAFFLKSVKTRPMCKISPNFDYGTTPYHQPY